MKEEPQELLISIEEAARVLSLSRQKTYALANSGELPSVRIGRSIRIRYDLLPAWLDAHQIEKAEA